jgi:hypothetical protein
MRLTDGNFWIVLVALFVGLTRQEFIHTYDKSAYEVRLELAMQFYSSGDSPQKAFDKADQFIAYLKTLKK